jgi:hypothetical protein
MSNLKLVLIGGAVLGIVGFLYVASHSGYDSRAHITEAINEASPLKDRVADFHAKNKSLPQAADVAAAKGALALKRARGIDWDPARRMVVITMEGEPYPGKRFAYVAEPRDDRIEWVCRPLDLEAKFLPAVCR